MKLKTDFIKDDETGSMNKRFMVCGTCSIAFGIFLVVFGVLTKYVFTDMVVNYEVYLNLDLKEDTPQYESWVTAKLTNTRQS